MIAVSDSSPLVILTKLGCLNLLRRLIPQPVISVEVYQEVVVVGKGMPGASDVEYATWIEKRELRDSQALVQARSQFALGAGELSTILLAKELQADLVLLDDRQARKLALRQDLKVMGTVGLLEALYARGHLSDLRETFAKLLRANVYIDKALLDRRLKSLGLLPL